MFIIGDVHGCLKTLQALIKKLPNQDDIIFVGDLIDRGPRSSEVLDYVRDHPQWQVVRGNHEDMMLDHFRVQVPTGLYPPRTWRLNKGNPDLYTLDQIEWVASWPLHLEFPDIQDEQGRYLFVSHAGPYYEDIEHCLQLNSFHLDLSIIWNRYGVKPGPDRYCVFGHNTEKDPVITESYAMIDTGCAYFGRHGCEYLTAFEFPSKKIYQQTNLDMKKGS